LKHNNIPIFIPELACPHRCVFCNQSKISATENIPTPDDITSIVEKYLASSSEVRHREIAFFGGSFTGIPFDLQEKYLKTAYQFVESGAVAGIRLSTRPDYINSEIIDLLKKYGVTAVELGAQSTDNEVLRISGRGHTRQDIERASKMILDAGFELGLQMMIGLPGDIPEKSMQTARDIVAFGARTTRIYPTIVIKDTPLENWFRTGKYMPLSLEEAVKQAKTLYKIFEKEQVKVIRVSLHPSEELSGDKSLIAGPFHPSFKELMMTELWHDILTEELIETEPGKIDIFVNKSQLNFAVGYEAKNKYHFENMGFKIKFKTDIGLEKYSLKTVMRIKS